MWNGPGVLRIPDLHEMELSAGVVNTVLPFGGGILRENEQENALAAMKSEQQYHAA